jgi:hypothetical protein
MSAHAAKAVDAAPSASATPVFAELLAFSDRVELKASDVVLSPDFLSVSRPSAPAGGSDGWARSKRGFGAGCGVVRWAIRLGNQDGGFQYKVGVASADFRDYCAGWPQHTFFFQQEFVMANGQHVASYNADKCFTAGHVVIVELERAPGVDGVLSVQIEGNPRQEWKGLPRDGMLYPIVCVCNAVQSYTMVALPVSVLSAMEALAGSALLQLVGNSNRVQQFAAMMSTRLPVKGYRLLYTWSKDGRSNASFHQHCDNQV